MNSMEMQCAIAAYKDGISLGKEPDMVYENMPVWYAPNSTKAVGVVGAAAIELKIGGHCIIYDDVFASLSDDTKSFILAHEAGHIKNGDTPFTSFKDQLKYLIACNYGISIREFNADRRASEKVGIKASINALKELSRTIGTRSAKRQCRNRAFALRLLSVVKVFA